jgi:hypothetical protein
LTSFYEGNTNPHYSWSEKNMFDGLPVRLFLLNFLTAKLDNSAEKYTYKLNYLKKIPLIILRQKSL